VDAEFASLSKDKLLEDGKSELRSQPLKLLNDHHEKQLSLMEFVLKNGKSPYGLVSCMGNFDFSFIEEIIGQFDCKYKIPIEKFKVIPSEDGPVWERKPVPWTSLTTLVQLEMLRDAATNAKIPKAFTSVDELCKKGASDDKIREELLKKVYVVPKKCHGSDHSFRAFFVAMALIKLAMEFSEEFKGITVEEVFVALFAALFHGTGRIGDVLDVCDSLSAWQAYNVLKKMGYPEDFCRKVADTINGKDAPYVGKSPSQTIFHDSDSIEISRVKTFASKYLNMNYLTLRHDVINEEFKRKIDESVIAAQKLIKNCPFPTSYTGLRCVATRVGLISSS
jgi:hypothetical protein